MEPLPRRTGPLPFARERGPFAGAEGHLDVPFVATPQDRVERMLDLAAVEPGDRLIDLGCGDGRIVIAAARRGALAWGIDVDPGRVESAQAAAEAAGVAERTRFEQGDLFAVPLAGFTVVTLFLLPHVNGWLEERLRSELPPGARVIGHAFAMPGWAPVAEWGAASERLYLWRQAEDPGWGTTDGIPSPGSTA